MMLRPLTLPRQKDEDVALLQLAHDLHRHLVALGRADDGRKARHAAIDQLDAPRTQLDVVDRAVEVVRPEPSLAYCVLPRHVEPRIAFRLLAADEADGLDRLGRPTG